jgi:hypothetical protein
MATTEDALVDRVRSVVSGLGYDEAVGFDFARTPTGANAEAFVVTFSGETPRGGTAFSEEATGLIEVALSQPVNNNPQTARRTVLQRLRTVLRAIVQDGAVTSGEYAVDDTGRRMTVEAPRGANFLIGRVRVPVNFEATL